MYLSSDYELLYSRIYTGVVVVVTFSEHPDPVHERKSISVHDPPRN